MNLRSHHLALMAAAAVALAAPGGAALADPPAAASPPASDSGPAAAPGPSQAPGPSVAGPSQADAAAAAPPASSVAPAETAPPQSDATQGPPLQLNFTDARPDNERKTRQYLTLWRFSCVFGVQELGDEFVDRVGQLRHDLTVAYGDRLVGKTIVVDHYHLYLNQRSMQGDHSWGTAVIGVFAIGLGADSKTTHPACTHDKMQQGWFDPTELTTPWSPFIVEMEVHIDGQDHLVHSVYSPPKNMPAPGILTDFDVKAEAHAVHAAIDKANLAMVAEVSRQLAPLAPVANP